MDDQQGHVDQPGKPDGATRGLGLADAGVADGVIFGLIEAPVEQFGHAVDGLAGRLEDM